MNIVLPILLWVPMLLIKAALFVAGLVIVPLGLRIGYLPALYRGTPGRPNTVWELAIRNPVDGLKRVVEHPQAYTEEGNAPVPFESLPMLRYGMRAAWQWRQSSVFASVRVVWLYSNDHYGEFYFGWKLGSAPPDFDFGTSLRLWAEMGN